MRKVIAVACIVVVGACGARPRVGVRNAEVMKHLDELGRDGHAQVDTVVVRGGGVTPADRETLFVDQTVTYRGTSTSLVALVTGCGAFAANKPCLLSARPDDVIVLRELERKVVETGPDGTPVEPKSTNEVAIVSGAFTLMSLGGIGLCVAFCEESKTEISLGLGGAALVFAVVWAVASGGRD